MQSHTKNCWSMLQIESQTEYIITSWLLSIVYITTGANHSDLWRSTNSSRLRLSHTRYLALGPELILVYRQPACRWLFKSYPCGRLQLLSTRPAVAFWAKECHCPSTSNKLYCWWQRHIGVNNLLKVVTQLCPGGNWIHNLLINALPLHHCTMKNWYVG